MYDYIFNDSPAARQFKIHRNIKAGQSMGYVGSLSMIGKKSRGCSPVTDAAVAPFDIRQWNPKPWDFRLSQCWAELAQTVVDYGLKAGVEAPNLIGTPIGDLIENLIRDAMAKMFLRFGWFGDTDAKTIEDGGTIATADDIEFFDVVDGVWKQIETMITAGTVTSIAIPANNEATTAAQLAATVDAKAIFTQLILNQPRKLAARPIAEKRLRASGLLVNKFKEQLLAENINTSEQFRQREDGIEVVKFLGYDIEAMHFWDDTISGQMTDTKMDRPYRAILTTEDNLNMGLDGDENTMEEIKVWYENMDRKAYFEGAGAIDIIVASPELVTVAGI